MFKKIFSIFAALTLSVGLWARDYKYIDADGQEKTAPSIKGFIDASSSTLEAGWYVVTDEDVKTGTLICQGDVHLILCDGAKLTATGAGSNAGIQVSGAENSLAIYGQINQSGQLIAEGGDLAAGIGGGCERVGSNITINGGTVTANGKLCAAGIGGGTLGSGSNITINRGTVKAKGGNYGAGIGGGNMGDGSNIIINGGTVEATGGEQGAGIGGGCERVGSNITINGGTVKAISTYAAAGIGGGAMASGSNITINGGTVTAECRNANTPGDAIGSGAFASTPASNIFVTTSLVIKAGDTENPTTEIAVERTSTTDIAADLVGKQYATIESPAGPAPVSTTYLDENGEEQTVDAWEVKDASDAATWGTAGQTTWFVVNGTNVTLSKGAICAGDVRLILADNAKLTATGVNAAYTPGIQVSGEGNSLTIYAQSTDTQMGQLIATGVMEAAGIGGGRNGKNGSNITINGGKVTANGGPYAAGIGGGQDGSGSYIIINGGEVMATGGSYAAGIGGGTHASGSNITINGGVVTANGGDMAAGIGGGTVFGSNIYISDAYVLKAGAAANPTEVIDHSSATDLGNSLNGKRYAKIEGLATPYTRSMTIDNWATVCLPYAATSFEGADFYKVNYYDASDPTDLKLYIEPVVNLEAGKPYIFHATDETVTIEHNATTPEEISAGYENGLYGSFARKTIAYDAEHAFAALANNTVNVIEEGYTVTVPACRAYFDMDDVPDFEQPHSAPLRCISIPSKNPTDLGQSAITNHKSAMKVVKNGQFRIVRDGKTYNAQGIEL